VYVIQISGGILVNGPLICTALNLIDAAILIKGIKAKDGISEMLQGSGVITLVERIKPRLKIGIDYF